MGACPCLTHCSWTRQVSQLREKRQRPQRLYEASGKRLIHMDLLPFASYVPICAHRSHDWFIYSSWRFFRSSTDFACCIFTNQSQPTAQDPVQIKFVTWCLSAWAELEKRWAYFRCQARGGSRFPQWGICLLAVELQMAVGLYIRSREEKKSFPSGSRATETELRGEALGRFIKTQPLQTFRVATWISLLTPILFFPLDPKAPAPAFSQFVNPDVKKKKKNAVVNLC